MVRKVSKEEIIKILDNYDIFRFGGEVNRNFNSFVYQYTVDSDSFVQLNVPFPDTSRIRFAIEYND